MANESKLILYLEQRQRRRWKTLKTGKIILSDAHFVIECIIRDLSNEGARLELPCLLDLPNTFTLSMPGGTTRECEVVRSSNIELSVHFLETTCRNEITNAHVDLAQRVQSIQNHLDEAQNRLNELRGDLNADVGG